MARFVRIVLTLLLFYFGLVCILDRNTSSLVATEFSLTFSQEFHMRHIDNFYSSLYETRHLGLLPIDVINDTSKYWLDKVYILALLLRLSRICSNKSPEKLPELSYVR